MATTNLTIFRRVVGTILLLCVAFYFHFGGSSQSGTSSPFERLVSCSRVGNPNECLTKSMDLLLQQQKRELTTVAYEATRFCLLLLQQQGFSDRNLIFSVQNCLGIAQIIDTSQLSFTQNTQNRMFLIYHSISLVLMGVLSYFMSKLGAMNKVFDFSYEKNSISLPESSLDNRVILEGLITTDQQSMLSHLTDIETGAERWVTTKPNAAVDFTMEIEEDLELGFGSGEQTKLNSANVWHEYQDFSSDAIKAEKKIPDAEVSEERSIMTFSEKSPFPSQRSFNICTEQGRAEMREFLAIKMASKLMASKCS